MVAQLTADCVRYKPYCVYLQKNFKARLLSKQGCFQRKVALHEAPQSSARSSGKKQNKKAKSSPEKREKKEEAKELQWSFANCLRRSAVKIERVCHTPGYSKGWNKLVSRTIEIHINLIALNLPVH